MVSIFAFVLLISYIIQVALVKDNIHKDKALGIHRENENLLYALTPWFISIAKPLFSIFVVAIRNMPWFDKNRGQDG